MGVKATKLNKVEIIAMGHYHCQNMAGATVCNFFYILESKARYAVLLPSPVERFGLWPGK